jgi:small subunit ribosomal protein S7
MARRRGARKREVLPDSKYNNILLQLFINCIVKRGKKRTAEGICYDALDILGQKTGEEAINVFKTAIENVKPTLEVKSRRIGGANYQVPVEVPAKRKTSLAFRWIISYARERTEKSMAEKIAGELLQAYKNEGNAIRKKVDTHKMAEANRAFAHFRW